MAGWAFPRCFHFNSKRVVLYRFFPYRSGTHVILFPCLHPEDMAAQYLVKR